MDSSVLNYLFDIAVNPSPPTQPTAAKNLTGKGLVISLNWSDPYRPFSYRKVMNKGECTDYSLLL